MAKLTIRGNTKPIVGNTEAYSLSVFENVITSNPFSFPPPKVKWDLYVQDRNGWRIVKGNIKEGENITYKFTAKSLKYKALRIEVVRGKDKGELYIKPQETEDPKIVSVELQDINSERLPKGKLLHYTDTIIVKAHCVGMFGYKVAFTLWEDDAIGKGHDPIVNMMNKINQIPLIGEVNHEGVAKVYFRLPAYTMAVQIANAGVAKGDKSEGKTHEYYVTAEVVSKHIVKASPNVNVANPSHIPAPPKKTKPVDNTLPHRKPPVAPEHHKTKPNKPKPKEETAKYPQTPAAKKQTDPEGKIVNAEFTDGRGKTLKNAKTGDTVSIKITSQGMRGKNVIVRIWEEDLSRYSNDLIYEVSATLPHDTSNFINYITLTKEMYNKSNDFGEGNEREYFIEVEHLNTSVTSQVIPISSDAEPVKVDPNDSPAIIKETKQEKKASCICQEQYKDLVWGGKVSCEFRKKVVEISKRQGFDANDFMAAMAHETGGTFDTTCGTFKKHQNEEKEGYVGLIQIGKDAAKTIGTTRTDLLKMNQLEQLDYVEKYLATKKGKLNTLTDFYLAILFPVDCGKGNHPNHIVFDNSLPISYKNGKAIKNLNYWRNIAYTANPAFHKEVKENGKTYVWEITKNINIWYDKGKSNKVLNFACSQGFEMPKTIINKGVWNVVITEKYTSHRCTHIEKTPVRNNCRRGKIDVYDHNGKIVLTISDCLLEGIAGENRNITNSDSPYGIYQISSVPFIMGASSGELRTSYGPYPRLSFEPIKGLGDEADKSGRSWIRIHGGRQETKNFSPRPDANLLRTKGCIRVWDSDAKKFYDWWVKYHKDNSTIKPGKLTLKK